MLTRQTKTVLKKHLQLEYEAFNVYLQIANEFCKLGWTNTFNFFLKQAQEELEHAYKILRYIESENDSIEYSLPTISDLGLASKDIEVNLLRTSLLQERKLSSEINIFCDTLLANSDHRTLQFMQWFVEEQKEEEEEFNDLIDFYENIDFNKKIFFEEYILTKMKD